MAHLSPPRIALLFLSIIAWPFALSIAVAEQPSRITFDSQCFTIDGKDTLIYSAAFHYFRCPKPLWRDRFQKLKEAGFNTVETYVAWNWHERMPPANLDDFSKVDMTDLDDWLTMAEEEFGFYTIVRPGPYICAEWDGGGYPQWLTLFRPKDFKGNWYRGDDAEYLKWCRHWYAAVAKATVPHLLTNKKVGGRGVIQWQLENEYDFAGKTPKEMLGQVSALGHMSREFGIDVPMFTCLTHNDALHNDPWIAANVFESANLYPGFGLADVPRRVEYLSKYQPNKPLVISELQGGWFATYGNKLSDQQGHTAAQITQLTLLMWELGFTSTNYYMGFGGTNVGDWASANLMTSYDYNAPVREPGGVTDRYFAVKGMGEFIAKEGDHLTRTQPLEINLLEKTESDVNVAVRVAKDGTRFVFVRTFDRDGPRRGTIRFVAKDAARDAKVTTVRYDIGPFGAKVCVLPPGVDDDAKGAWYPEPAAAPQRPAKLPAPIEITSVMRKYDSLPDQSQFDAYADGKSVEDFGVFDRRTTVYRASVDLKSLVTEAGKPVLNLTLRDRDDANVIVNGQRAPQIAINDGEADYRIDSAKSDGLSEVVVVYENGGRPNSGPGMERRNGLSRAVFGPSSTVSLPLSEWRSHVVEGAAVDALVKSDLDDHAWPAIRLDRDRPDQPEGSTFVYRASFDLADGDSGTPRDLKIGRIDDSGSVYVNGELVGTSTSWSEVFHAQVTKQLKVGRNVIAVVVHNDQGGGGLSRGVSLQPIRQETGEKDKVAWTFSPGTAGMLAGWAKADVDDSGWENIAITGRPIEADMNAPLAWYRASFELPAKDPKAWIPWKIRLNIAGNAFLYLNGEPLGRYWNAGPQRDFYLPENLLKQGPGEKNVLTAAVRGIDKPEFRSATVLPYEDQAETR
jgi:hypothetical protein